MKVVKTQIIAPDGIDFTFDDGKIVKCGFWLHGTGAIEDGYDWIEHSGIESLEELVKTLKLTYEYSNDDEYGKEWFFKTLTMEQLKKVCKIYSFCNFYSYKPEIEIITELGDKYEKEWNFQICYFYNMYDNSSISPEYKESIDTYIQQLA